MPSEDYEREGLLAAQAAADDPDERYVIEGLSNDEALAVLELLERRGLVHIGAPNRGNDRLLAARRISLTAGGQARLADHIASAGPVDAPMPSDPTIAWRELRAVADPFSPLDRAINEAVGDLTSRGMFRSGPSLRWAMETAYDFDLEWNPGSESFTPRRGAATADAGSPTAAERTRASTDPTDAEQAALDAAWASNVPTAASALHARWWQLEAWLRSLVYVELRAKFGTTWSAQLPGTADARRAKDAAAQRYMSTPDATDHLAYLDVGDLFQVIEAHWDLFAPTLIDQTIWQARVLELNKIRRRIAHCRRPHADDLGRLEQTLRDLDHGAFRAMALYNERQDPDRDLGDPLVRSWVKREHPGADIIDHAGRQYDTRFRLSYSARPWARPLDSNQPISGEAGYLWHATWYGAHVRDLGEWWRDGYLDIDGWRDLIVYACADMYSVDISFAACDDPAAIAKGIEHAFQATLQRYDFSGLSLEQHEELGRRWTARAVNLDLRVQVQSGWCFLTTDLHPVTIFSA